MTGSQVGGDDHAVKTAFADTWAVSDYKAAFIHAVQERGHVAPRRMRGECRRQP